jgi:hypothetical protein
MPLPNGVKVPPELCTIWFLQYANFTLTVPFQAILERPCGLAPTFTGLGLDELYKVD